MNWDTAINGAFAAIGGLAGLLLGRRKQNAEAISVEVANAQEVLKMWEKTATLMQERVAKLEKDIAIMHEEMQALRRENQQLRDELHGSK
jgi:regulator of replication initiation timing